MSWICPNPECSFENSDDVIVCPCDGTYRRTRLVLSTPEGGSWRTAITMDVTRRAYGRLYPGVEHQYVPHNEGAHPFSVVKAANGAWQLVANASCPIRTVLNTVPCEGGRAYPLKPGDEIAIAPASNPASLYAPLRVSFVPVE